MTWLQQLLNMAERVHEARTQLAQVQSLFGQAVSTGIHAAKQQMRPMLRVAQQQVQQLTSCSAEAVAVRENAVESESRGLLI